MNATFLQAGFVRAEIDKLLSAYPELADDESLRADMIEAETDALKVIDRALVERLEAVAMAEAVKAQESDMGERRRRFERKAEAMRALIQGIMNVAQLPKVILPRATVSILDPRVVVNVTDVNELPQGFYKTERKADKAALKSALEKGEAIPGAELAFGDEGLLIRTK